MTRLRARSKIWIEVDGVPVLGQGRQQLLEAIAATGSISAAARRRGISYRKAWSQLADMEKQLPFPLLERKVGGRGGGMTRLTPDARELLAKFRKLLDGNEEFVDRRFHEVFE